MSLNFTILDEREAPLDNVLVGPNPAEEPGATNGAINVPAPGCNDGFDVGEENVGNVPVSDRSRSDQKKTNHLGRSHGRRACLAELGTAEIGRGWAVIRRAEKTWRRASLTGANCWLGRGPRGYLPRARARLLPDTRTFSIVLLPFDRTITTRPIDSRTFSIVLLRLDLTITTRPMPVAPWIPRPHHLFLLHELLPQYRFALPELPVDPFRPRLPVPPKTILRGRTISKRAHHRRLQPMPLFGHHVNGHHARGPR